MIYFYCIVSNDQIHLADQLRKSLLKFGHHLQILPIYDFNLKNLSKIYKLYNYLENIEYEHNDIIVLTDAFDVVCVSNPDKLYSYFERTKNDILISSENMFGPNYPVIKEYYDNYNSVKGIEKTKSRYPNSGVIIGKAKKLQTFYKNLTEAMPKLKKFFPSNASNTASDQAHIINYLYEINFIEYKELKIELDLFDDIVFTNTINEQEYNIDDFVFIHTWGIYLKQPEYKHIKDKQYLKWTNINKYLKLDDNKSFYTFCLLQSNDLLQLKLITNKILPKIQNDFEIFVKTYADKMKCSKLMSNYNIYKEISNCEILYRNTIDLASALKVHDHYKIWKQIFTSTKYDCYKYFYIIDNDDDKYLMDCEKKIDFEFDIILLNSTNKIEKIDDNLTIKSLSQSYIISKSGLEKMMDMICCYKINYCLIDYLRLSSLKVFLN